MKDIERIVQLDCDYISSFAKQEVIGEGILFYNEEQPDYYDANHAHIWKRVKNPKQLLETIVNFYERKGLVPRIYLYNLSENEALIREFSNYHFKHEQFSNTLQKWNGELAALPEAADIEIERVTEENMLEALEIECSITEFGGRSVREKAFLQEYHSPYFTFFLLRYKGVACCTASIFQSKEQARIESVATLATYRGKGLIQHLLHALQRYTLENEIDILWILPINERVERVYEKSNFVRISAIDSIHAFTRGKSIQEIREQ